jgi:peroxiredoxin family protein
MTCFISDATNLPASKAGSVAHFESETLADNILLYLEGKPLKKEFDGHSNCFIESGNGKALLIDFSYEQAPHEVSAFATGLMNKEMEKLDIPPVGEFLELISDSGGKIYACKLAMDIFKLKREDLRDRVHGVLTVGQFCYIADAVVQELCDLMCRRICGEMEEKAKALAFNPDI